MINGIPPIVLKIPSRNATIPTRLFQIETTKAYFLETGKVLVYNSFQSDSKIIPSNYGPILLLPVISRILELVINSVVFKYRDQLTNTHLEYVI